MVNSLLPLEMDLALHRALIFTARAIVARNQPLFAKLDQPVACIAAYAGHARFTPCIVRHREMLHGDALIVIGGTRRLHRNLAMPSPSALARILIDSSLRVSALEIA